MGEILDYIFDNYFRIIFCILYATVFSVAVITDCVPLGLLCLFPLLI